MDCLNCSPSLPAQTLCQFRVILILILPIFHGNSSNISLPLISRITLMFYFYFVRSASMFNRIIFLLQENFSFCEYKFLIKPDIYEDCSSQSNRGQRQKAPITTITLMQRLVFLSIYKLETPLK